MPAVASARTPVDAVALMRPPAVKALIASAAVRALPEPAPNGNQAYLWAYKTIHFLLANFDKSAGAGK